MFNRNETQTDPFDSLGTKTSEDIIYSGFTTMKISEENSLARSFTTRTNDFFTNLFSSGISFYYLL